MGKWEEIENELLSVHTELPYSHAFQLSSLEERVRYAGLCLIACKFVTIHPKN